MFQSTPAPIGAGDRGCAHDLIAVLRFNPHPLRSERATCHERHQPYAGKGFNPHPLTVTSLCEFACFNPHPLVQRKPLVPVQFQSTPAPIGAGDEVGITNTLGVPLFQSTPAPIGAGDCSASCRRRSWPCFNPHPLRSERATLRVSPAALVDLVSIHTRSDRSGRHQAHQRVADGHGVSIHTRSDRSG